MADTRKQKTNLWLLLTVSLKMTLAYKKRLLYIIYLNLFCFVWFFVCLFLAVVIVEEASDMIQVLQEQIKR